MSERTYAPRSGGRAAEPRSAAGRRGTGSSRDAETQVSEARGARAFTEPADTRRSGIRNDEAADGRSGARRDKPAGGRAGVRKDEAAGLSLRAPDLSLIHI